MTPQTSPQTPDECVPAAPPPWLDGAAPRLRRGAANEASPASGTTPRELPTMEASSTEGIAGTSVVVVGAGVGGMATAARLSKAGCR